MKHLVPIVKEIIGDLDTPVSAYLKLNQPSSFLLESVVGGEQVARYSYIGFDPFLTLKSSLKDKPVDQLQKLVQGFQMDHYADLPHFIGGAVGFFSWEVISTFEKVKLRKKKASELPVAHFLFPSSLVVFDHAKRKMILIVLVEEKKKKEAVKKLEKIEALLRKPLANHPLELNELPANSLKAIKSDFINGVKKVKNYIYEGDIFQLVLSQKFQVKSKKKPFDVYRALRYINPSPYMFYMNFNDYQLIGSSPELLVQLTDRKAVTRPLAGTRPRPTKNEQAVIDDLKSDDKEKAEHIMLVDLGRNDLGRVCDFGSVKTTELMDVEAYSHVLHMVSHVEGRLKKNKNAFDLFRATFPAGTLSGTPKVRAMEIIEELESEQRGPYGGALGYFDFRGNMDLCIIIRTILSKNSVYTVQAGAGIVADSDPEKEYEESRNKARGMVKACY